MSGFLNGSASKFLVSVMTALCTWLTTSYGTAKWEPVVITAIGALMVFLVPNSAKPSAAPKDEPPARM